jgi:Fur family transcriptional regulator, ferric uptake regulator
MWEYKSVSRKLNNHSKDSTSNAVEESKLFEIYLRGKGLRLTRPRRLIFDEVFSVHGHVDAEELAAHLREPGKKVSRASVYRTLDLLAEANLVKPIRLLGGKQRVYEHIHSGEHHDHLVCTECGRIQEFFSEGLENLQSKVCKEHEFRPVRHTMIVYGLCGQCNKK